MIYNSPGPNTNSSGRIVYRLDELVYCPYDIVNSSGRDTNSSGRIIILLYCYIIVEHWHPTERASNLVETDSCLKIDGSRTVYQCL